MLPSAVTGVRAVGGGQNTQDACTGLADFWKEDRSPKARASRRDKFSPGTGLGMRPMAPRVD